jgi:hypothetical protein
VRVRVKPQHPICRVKDGLAGDRLQALGGEIISYRARSTRPNDFVAFFVRKKP